MKELRERLAKDEIMLTQYNEIIQSQLGDGIKRLLNQMSLNEIFYCKPCLNPEFYNLLLKFYSYPVAITANIEKAYLHISVEEKDRDYLRFLWFSNLFDNEEVKDTLKAFDSCKNKQQKCMK